MKRFSKILTLILALVAIVTAFTVVALAEDAAEPKAVNVGGFRLETHFDHEYWTIGKVWGSNSGSLGDGEIKVNEAYPGGNKFLHITGTGTSTTTLRYQTFFGGVNGKTDYTIRSTYAFNNYPIAVLDFDIMSPTGVWGVTTGDNDNNSNNAALYIRPYIGSSQQGVVGNKKVEFRHLGLTTTPYEWSHVTIVYQYSEETVDNGDGTTTTTSYVTQTCYVNGVQCEGTRVNGKIKVTVANAQKMWFGSLYIQNSRYGYTEQAIDNIEFTYCQANYDVSKLPTAIYNDTWEAPFGKLLATVTVGEGEDAVKNYFDDYNEAIAFANANPGSVAVRVNNDETETPFEEIYTHVKLGDAVTYFTDVDAAVEFANANPGCVATHVDANGNATPFEQIFPSVTVGNATKYFADLGDAAAYAAATPDSKLTLVADITANYTVDSVFSIDANVYDAEGGIIKTYTGIDTYARTTKGYYMKETAEGSGIYVATMGDFMVSQTDGSYIAYPESEFTARIFKANSTTLKLLNDIEVDAVFTVNKTNYTIDLNGYSLKRVSYYGGVYNYDEAAGDYVKADTGITNKGTTMFALNHATGAYSYGFLITSSNGQGSIYNVNYYADSYYKDGELVERKNLVSQPTYLLYTQATYTSTENKFTFENFDHYGGIILQCDFNGRKNLNFYFDNIRHYQMNAYASNNAQHAFYLSANNGFNLQVTNSLFYFNDHATNMTSGLIRLVAALVDGYTTDIKFINCDIIANNDGADKVGIMNSQSGENIQFIDCRIYNFDTTINDVRTSQGTLVNYKNGVYHIPAALDGWSNKTLAKNVTKTYTVPEIYNYEITDGAIQSVITNVPTKEYVCTFNRICTQEVDVTVGENTVKLIPGVSTVYDNKALRIYADTESDMLLNKIYLLKDAEGNVIESILGIYDDKFIFDWENACVLTASEKTAFVGGIKADFNLNFLTGFRYNLYVPADARLSDVVVEGFEKAANTVILYGNEYLVYTKIVGTAEAAEANVISATFKVDGVAYSQTWNINAISYADMLLDYPSAQYPNEAAALGAMAKFIKEAALLTPDTTADVAAVDALIAKSGVATELGTYTEGNADCLAPFEGAVNGMQFVVYNGVAAYKFFTEAEDTEISFVVNGENVEFERGSGTDEEGKPVYYVILDAMRVYDIIDPISVTANGVTAKVSMLDYLTAMEGNAGMELAKALYEFGLAADDYKKDIMANN